MTIKALFGIRKGMPTGLVTTSPETLELICVAGEDELYTNRSEDAEEYIEDKYWYYENIYTKLQIIDILIPDDVIYGILIPGTPQVAASVVMNVDSVKIIRSDIGTES